MNLVGRIFIVAILVMSVVFMAFAMAVYATHKNWREEVLRPQDQVTPGKELGLKFQLDKARADNEKLKRDAEELKQQYDRELAAKVQAVTKLENELKLRKDELAALEAKQAELEKAQRAAVAAMQTTQANATDYRKELDTHRTTLADARKDRDAHFKRVTELTDQLNQAQNEKDLLKKRTEELGKDLAKADQVLRKFNLDKNKNLANVPPIVDGIITATPGNSLVEISIGADEGLLKGHKLEVFRIGAGQSEYVGRIEVVQTAPDKAVCKIDPKFQNSNMVVGDRVATKIE